MVNVIIPRPGAIWEPPGMWPGHDVKHPQAMLANLQWFMKVWATMQVGQILSTDAGAYERTAVGWKRHVPETPLPKPADLGMRPAMTVPDDTPVDPDGPSIKIDDEGHHQRRR
jgi:hypothetical protein